MQVNCCCCGKQIVSYGAARHDKYITKGQGAVPMGTDKWCCGYCAEGLDEWGLFPEERHLYPELYN